MLIARQSSRTSTADTIRRASGPRGRRASGSAPGWASPVPRRPAATTFLQMGPDFRKVGGPSTRVPVQNSGVQPLRHLALALLRIPSTGDHERSPSAEPRRKLMETVRQLPDGEELVIVQDTPSLQPGPAEADPRASSLHRRQAAAATEGSDVPARNSRPPSSSLGEL